MSNPPKLMEDSPIGPINTRMTAIPGVIYYDSANRSAYWLSPERQAQLPAWVKEPDGTVVNTHQDPAWWEGPEKNIVLLAFEQEFRQAYCTEYTYNEDPDWEEVAANARSRFRKSHPTLYARYERSRA